jgi:VWFA-related protein
VGTRSADPATIRALAAEVQVTFSAEDKRGHILPDLTASDISVLEDNRPVSAFTSFHRSSDLPLRLALMVDQSDSMQKAFPKELHAAEVFLQRLVQPATDSVFLVEFSSQASFSQPPKDHPELIFASYSRPPQATLTALYDALFKTAIRMDQEAKPSSEQPPSRRAILLLSDGEDNLSMHTLGEVVDLAERSEIAIYAITAHSRRGPHPGDATLRQLADLTGGHAFVLDSFEHAGPVLAQIEQELRTRYSVSFHPGQSRCGAHKITILHRNPQVHIRARDHYFQCGSEFSSTWKAFWSQGSN